MTKYRFIKIAFGVSFFFVLGHLMVGQDARHEPLSDELRRHDEAISQLQRSLAQIVSSMVGQDARHEPLSDELRRHDEAISQLQRSLAQIVSSNGDVRANSFITAPLSKGGRVVTGSDKDGDGFFNLNDRNGQKKIEGETQQDGNGHAGYLAVFGRDEKVGAVLGVDHEQGYISLEGKKGLDLSEDFPVSPEETIPLGSVVAIDPLGTTITLSRTSYTQTVIGVVSGAGILKPAIRLGKSAPGHTSTVAVAGQVYVRANSEGGPIAPGDLLVASSTPGIAMRAADLNKASGAVVGKALEAFPPQNGKINKGLVRMLVMSK